MLGTLAAGAAPGRRHWVGMHNSTVAAGRVQAHARLAAPANRPLPCPARRVVKLVRALRKGWIKREQEPEKPAAYLLWEDDGAPPAAFRLWAACLGLRACACSCMAGRSMQPLHVAARAIAAQVPSGCPCARPPARCPSPQPPALQRCTLAPTGRTADKTATGLTYIPAPKLKLPGHEESYNPPAEYLPTEVGGGAALARWCRCQPALRAAWCGGAGRWLACTSPHTPIF